MKMKSLLLIAIVITAMCVTEGRRKKQIKPRKLSIITAYDDIDRNLIDEIEEKAEKDIKSEIVITEPEKVFIDLEKDVITEMEREIVIKEMDKKNIITEIKEENVIKDINMNKKEEEILIIKEKEEKRLIEESIKTRNSANIKNPVRVGSWNIQRVGQTKLSKPEVLKIIVKVIREFDIMVVLEVVDVEQKAPTILLNALNEGVTDPAQKFSLTISQRLGRTTYKEQYAYYYKNVVSVDSTYQFNDTAQDIFQFEPFIVVFKGNFAGIDKFGIAPIHTKPDDAVKEIDGLTKVYDKFTQDTGIKDLMIMGDYNAGCTYVTGKEWANISLFTQSRFHWLIDSHYDTTTKGTSCPYDRIVVGGSDLYSSVYENSAKPVYFDDDLNLTDSELIEDVSDHYPVEVLIRGDITTAMQTKVGSKIGIAVYVSSDVTLANMDAMVAKQMKLLCTEAKDTSCLKQQQIVLLEWTSADLETTVKDLTTFSSNYPDVLSPMVLEALEYKLRQNVLDDASLHGEHKVPKDLTTEVLCRPTTGICTFTVKTSTTLN